MHMNIRIFGFNVHYKLHFTREGMSFSLQALPHTYVLKPSSVLHLRHACEYHRSSTACTHWHPCLLRGIELVLHVFAVSYWWCYSDKNWSSLLCISVRKGKEGRKEKYYEKQQSHWTEETALEYRNRGKRRQGHPALATCTHILVVDHLH